MNETLYFEYAEKIEEIVRSNFSWSTIYGPYLKHKLCKTYFDKILICAHNYIDQYGGDYLLEESIIGGGFAILDQSLDQSSNMTFVLSRDNIIFKLEIQFKALNEFQIDDLLDENCLYEHNGVIRCTKPDVNVADLIHRIIPTTIINSTQTTTPITNTNTTKMIISTILPKSIENFIQNVGTLRLRYDSSLDKLILSDLNSDLYFSSEKYEIYGTFNDIKDILSRSESSCNCGECILLRRKRDNFYNELLFLIDGELTDIENERKKEESLKGKEKEKEMTKPEQNKETFLVKQKERATKAVYRAATNQGLQAAKASVLLLLQKNGLNPEKLEIAKEILDIQLVDAALRFALGLGLEHAPMLAGNTKLLKVAEELQVSGYAVGLDEVANLAKEYLMPVASTILAAMPEMESDKKVRVEEEISDLEEETSILEEQLKEEEIHKKLIAI